MSDGDTTEDRPSALILQTHGRLEPRRAYAPVFYAMTAAAMEMDTTMWYTMEGTSQLEEGIPETVKAKPDEEASLADMLDRAMATGVEITACQQSLDLNYMEEDDLIDGVEVIGAASIIDMALDADLVMYF